MPLFVATVVRNAASLGHGAGDPVVSSAVLRLAFGRAFGRAGIVGWLIDVVVGAADHRFVPSGRGVVHRVAMTAPSGADVQHTTPLHAGVGVVEGLTHGHLRELGNVCFPRM